MSSSANWRAIPRPTGEPFAHSAGGDPDKILLFGSGPVMGYGVLTHELSLAGALSRELSAVTGRGIDADVITEFDITMSSALKLLEQTRLSRYDALLIAVGTNDAVGHTSVSAWRKSTEAVLRYASAQVPATTQVFVLGVQPSNDVDLFSWPLARLVQARALNLNAETRRVCEQFPNVSYVEVPGKTDAPVTPTTGRRSADTYTAWARALAPQISGHLRRWVDDTPARRLDDDSELGRQRALDALGILDTAPEERFDRVVRLAHQLFGSEAATLSFIDHDRVWFKSSIGIDTPEVPRTSSFSDYSISRDGILVLEDAREDDRFRDHPLVAGEAAIRFFVGHPVETREGERVGILSVFSRRPRSVTKAERALMRDLALLVQQELCDG